MGYNNMDLSQFSLMGMGNPLNHMNGGSMSIPQNLPPSLMRPEMAKSDLGFTMNPVSKKRK